jgi:hypothetical protein
MDDRRAPHSVSLRKCSGRAGNQHHSEKSNIDNSSASFAGTATLPAATYVCFFIG